MRKYWHVVQIGVQNTLVYRANFFFRSAFALIPLLATIYLWRAIYAGRADSSDVAGYSLAKMISYYLVITVVDALTAVTDDDWQVAGDIKDGNINQFLLKPINYLTYRLCLFGAGRLVYSMVAVIPLSAFLIWHRAFFFLPASFSTYGWFCLSLVLTGLLQFFISYTMALLAFWLLEVSTLILMLFALEYLASGHLFPLDILPPGLSHLLALTPFPYELFFPVSIYLEQAKGAALYRGLLIQLSWVVATYVLARWVWRRGIKRYAAVGG